MLNYYYASLRKETAVKLNKFKQGCWVDIKHPTDQERKDLEKLNLDSNLLEDAFDIHEVPRVEISNGKSYFFTRLPTQAVSSDDLPTFPLLVVLDDFAIYTVSKHDLSKLWKPLLEDSSVATTQRTKLFILIVDQITKNYRDHLNLINKKVRMISSGIHNVNKKKVMELIEYERRLNDYLDSISPTNDALENMLDGRGIKLYEDDKEILEDLSLSFEQLIVRCRSMIKAITNIRDSYRIILDSRLNDTIKLLTVITVSMTIPTMIAGIYGMNIQLPGNPNHPAYFWLLLFGSFALSLSFGLYFYKKR